MASIDTPHTQTQYPSQVVEPTRTDSIPQQASTQPGDGSEVRVVDKRARDELLNDPNVNVIEVPGQKVPFKDQVIGYAQKARGSLLGKPDLKDNGNKILEGQVPAREDSKYRA